MKQDNRKKPQPLFNGMPDHVRKLREQSEASRRAKERREFQKRNNPDQY